MVEVVINVVVGEVLEVLQTDFFAFLKYYCLGKMMGVRLVREGVVWWCYQAMRG